MSTDRAKRLAIKALQEAACARPAGFYTELIRKHNWPPGFEPAPFVDKPLRGSVLAGLAAGAEAMRSKGRRTR